MYLATTHFSCDVYAITKEIFATYVFTQSRYMFVNHCLFSRKKVDKQNNFIKKNHLHDLRTH